MNFSCLDRRKVCKNKIICLYSPNLKVHGTKTSAPLRFSELGKQRASQNSIYLTREACSKNMICKACKVSKRSWRPWIVPKLLAHKICPKNCVFLFLIGFQTQVLRYPNTLFFTALLRCIYVTYMRARICFIT